MGLLDKLSAWLGGGRVAATVLVLGLDNAGKSSLLAAMRAQDARAAAAHGPAQPIVPTVAPQQDHFQSMHFGNDLF